MKTQNKFLIQILQGVSHQQIFFLVWFGIAFGFVMLMMAHYRKQTRSNFRKPSDGPKLVPKVDARKIGSPQKAEIAIKKDVPPTQRR